MAEKGIDIEIIRPGDTSVEITAGSGLVFDLTVPPSTNVEITTVPKVSPSGS